MLVPYYWVTYTPWNFLYFCDVALVLTLVAVWTENALLVSMDDKHPQTVMPELWLLLIAGSSGCADSGEVMADAQNLAQERSGSPGSL